MFSRGLIQRTVTSNLSKAYETRDSLSSICSPIVLVHFQPFRRNSPLKCGQQPKIAKNLYFESSRSFKVIDVITAKKLVTGACYDKQHVYVYQKLFSC